VGKVFISYSHDSPEHSERVLALSNQLLALGIETELDRYHVRPPQGWPHWCEEQLRPEVSSFVLVICTETYRARVERRVGADEGRGVFWEGAILYNYIYNAKGNSRFIPVLLDDAPEAAIPMPLDGQTRYRISAFAVADPGFGALYRELTCQPETTKPALGEVIRLDALSAPIATKAMPEKQAKWGVGPDGRPFDQSGRGGPNSSEAGAPENATLRGSFWSPFSNEETVDRGEVRFWAIVETLVAVAVFWWVAIRYESFLLLTTSLFIAPLLLLRSHESTELGVRWFNDGMFPPRWPDDDVVSTEAVQRWVQRWLIISGALGIAATLGLGFYVVGPKGWGAARISFASLALLIPISWLSVAVAVAGAVALMGAGTVAGAVAEVGTRAAAFATMVAFALLFPVMGATAVVLTVLSNRLPRLAIARTWETIPQAVAKARAQTGADAKFGIAILAASPSVLLGIWFATLMFRFAATARYARAGYRSLPANVRRLALCMTPCSSRSFFPGSGRIIPYGSTFSSLRCAQELTVRGD
jgi:TIR domain